MDRFKVIEGGDAPKPARKRDRGQAWYCPVCQRDGRGAQSAAIEIYTQPRISKDGQRVSKGPKALHCLACYQAGVFTKV